MNIIKKIFKKTTKRIRRVPDRFFWWLKIRHAIKKVNLKINDNKIWEKAYLKSCLLHSHKNKLISIDFLKKIDKSPFFLNIFKNNQNIIDFGCGTGELSYFINKKYKTKKILGVEISETAVKMATILYKSNNIDFSTIKPDTDLKTLGKFDVAVCCNVLEHFSNPYVIIDKIFEISPIIIVLVPYEQPVIDVSEEGGGGHIFKFSKESFNRYNILDSFVFETLGWDYSSLGEDPKQFAIAIKKK